MLTNVVDCLPLLSDVGCTTTMTDDVAQRVVHTHFVIKPIEACSDVVAIEPRVVDLADETQVRILLFHLRDDPAPELHWNHEHHVAAEGINTLACPEEQHVEHLVPRVGYRVEMTDSAGIIVYSIIEFHRFIPVVAAGSIVEVVVARCFGGQLLIGKQLAVIEVEIRREGLSGTIIEIVLR